MNDVSRLRVTLDTNVCDILHEPEKAPALMEPDSARRLRQAIEEGAILAFVAEASLFVECLDFKDKLEYLAVAGTVAPRPSANPRFMERLRGLGAIGVRILRGPLLGGEIFVPYLEYADDVDFTAAERTRRFGEFARHRPGRKPVMAFGQQLLDQQPPLPSATSVKTGPDSTHWELRQDWAIAIKRAWDNADASGQKALRKQVAPLIGEWCDTLIVAAHYGYGNNLFCTADEGRGAGRNSILFHENRSKLQEDGIVVVSPMELARRLL
ncbi:hypothetical protein [Burkholderia glumae]|uniref:hypothetical protein n=1 Tax=Burkholderia glumae TaxID=337 RepID=UPI00148EEBC0|nr:hypothetical protein [Burkholderia glumae]QJW80061.1 hypothetical protein GAS18_15745 [Burkholderia glumae]